MDAYRFQIVSVFAEQRFGGNPLAAFADAAGWPDEDMQRIARQFNLSVSVFLFPGNAGCAAIPRWAARRAGRRFHAAHPLRLDPDPPCRRGSPGMRRCGLDAASPMSGIRMAASPPRGCFSSSWAR
ncbi:PhzF family phenazine biosynthesis protein [Chromobacterium phragmitis]|uniref:PhzF family phenazine biosynthesis protein n=2 Tax=Chromobacterium phragmitis TaxID=2202141 RepID=UPI001F19DCE0|nr:PhzF family phenazine biosynthesis protein [Chromobacterium phragmitis]